MPSQKGQSVAQEMQHPVVILYKHALLGEGIATYLRAQVGVEATVASEHDVEAVTSALALGPSVVIFESHDPFRQFDLATLAPHAVLIDVSTVITRGSAVSPGIGGLDQILQAVLDSGSAACPVGTRPARTDLYRKSTVRRMGTPEQ